MRGKLSIQMPPKALTFDDQMVTRELHKATLSWFYENGRKFPWRDTSDAYQVLVAEVCLQKTNADKVAPVFQQIIGKYPTMNQLAKADLRDLNAYFSHLGLFKRGYFLLQIAKDITNDYGGAIPKDREALLKVKGIGEYTANSVLCLAYRERLPLLDGSTQRVLSRVYGLKVNKPAWANKSMRAFMETILPDSEAREFNLALIDIAAKYCRPKKPKCGDCPLAEICLSPTRLRGQNDG